MDFPEVGAQFFKSSLPGLPADWSATQPFLVSSRNAPPHGAEGRLRADWPCGQLKYTVKVRFTDQWRIQQERGPGDPEGPAISYLRVWMTPPPPYLKVWICHCGHPLNTDASLLRTVASSLSVRINGVSLYFHFNDKVIGP